MRDEEWKNVPNWEGFYQVSSYGEVRSLDRPGRKGRVLRQATVHTTGYKRVTLMATPRREQWDVQRLVALAFLGACPAGYQVRHRDGHRTNNHADNLEYGTPGENRLDSVAHGTHRNARKEECKRGHPLTGRNLFLNKTSRGTPSRKCRSCNLAMQAGKRQGWYPDEPTWQQVADEYYKKYRS